MSFSDFQRRKFIRAIRRPGTKLACGLAVLFVVMAAIQYWFVRHQVFRTVQAELTADANEINQEIAYLDKWSLKGFRQASISAQRWTAVTATGLILDFEGFIPGLFQSVAVLDDSIYAGPQTVVTEVREKWRLLGIKVHGGAVIVGVLEPEDLKKADNKLTGVLKKFGTTMEAASRVKPREVDWDIDFALITNSGELKFAAGAVPLKIDPRDLPVISRSGYPIYLSGKPYSVVTMPIRSASHVPVGTIITARNVTAEQRTLKDHIWFSLGAAFTSFVAAVILALHFMWRDFARPLHPSLAEALSATTENQELEFKPAFRLQATQPFHNREGPLETLKTVAGFLNAKGGTLFVGIGDDRTICGVERDLGLVDGSRDRFDREVHNLISAKIGPDLVPFVMTRFEQEANRTVYVLDVDPSPKPAFVKWDDKTYFFVRQGGRTLPLDPKEQDSYTRTRWRD